MTLKIAPINILLKIITSIVFLVSNYFFILTIHYPSSINIELFIIFFLLYNFLKPIVNYAFKINEIKSCNNLELTLLHSIQTKDILYLESENFSKSIALLDDIRNKFNDKQNDIFDFIDSILSMIGICFFLSFYISYIYILIYFLLNIFFVFRQYKLSLYTSSTTYEFWKKYRENTRLYNEYSNVLTQKKYIIEKNIFNYMHFFVNKFSDEFNNAASKNTILGKKRLLIESKEQLVYFIIYLFDFLFLIYFIYHNIIPVDFFVAILPQTILNATKMSALFFSINDYKEIVQYECDLKKLINLHCKPYLLLPASPEFALQIKNISFSYTPSQKNIINNLSFNFKKGGRYALIGENGCGKTTLVKLMCGLYKPQYGEIKKNGRIRVLFQNFNKYAASIKDNICLGDYTDEKKIIHALQSVDLVDDFNSYANELNTELTNLKPTGIELSGGQWQRLALSRVLFQDADIVILDEPTSNLDPIVEKKLYDKYLHIFNGKTLLMITHRLGFIRNFDEVLVIKDGMIIEHGNPITLSKNIHSIYRKMLDDQKKLYEY
ncbi:ABC transporter family protein [Chlamydia trachomatis]|jgi:ATP-binding cassette subfamily B protein|nr:ABC transporter family protein [Chlamydia trachomatis]